MTEHRLQRAQIRAALKQVRGKSVTQDVRADSLGRNTGFGGEITEKLEQTHPAEVRFARRKQPRPRTHANDRPCRHRLTRAVGHRDEPLPPALPFEDRKGPVHRNCPDVERDKFGRAQARTIEQLDQRREPQIRRTRRAPLDAIREHRKQPRNVIMIKASRQTTRVAGARQRMRGIIAAMSLINQKTEKATA